MSQEKGGKLLNWKAKRAANSTGKGGGGSAANPATQAKPPNKSNLSEGLQAGPCHNDRLLGRGSQAHHGGSDEEQRS